MLQTTHRNVYLIKGTSMDERQVQPSDTGPCGVVRSRSVRKNGSCPMDFIRLASTKPYEELTDKPISSKQAALLKASWKKLRLCPNPTIFCNAIVRRMLAGDLKHVHFVHRSSCVRAAHVDFIADLLDKVVDALDDLPACKRRLNDIGRRHQQFADLRGTHWDEFGEALNETAHQWLRAGGGAIGARHSSVVVGDSRETARAWTCLAVLMADQLRAGQLRFRRHSERPAGGDIRETAASVVQARKCSSAHDVHTERHDDDTVLSA